jgi:glutaredoxin
MKRFYHPIVVVAAAALLWAAPSSAEVGCNTRVTMYNAWWCPYCRQVRAILARNHIIYSILDATSPQVQAIMVRRFGDTAVPRTVIGGVVVEGVDETRMMQLCRR